jgi:D-serine deaminase-like pyridoxal phosphate-dependent protein
VIDELDVFVEIDGLEDAPVRLWKQSRTLAAQPAKNTLRYGRSY